MRKKRINRLLACICLLFCTMPQLLNAQKKVPMNMPGYDNEPYHYGFIVGYNQMFYTLNCVDNLQNIRLNNLNNDVPIIEFPNNGNIAEYTISELSNELSHGFTVGIVGNLRLSKYFDLRLIPSLGIGNRIISYTVKLYESNNDENYCDIVTIKSFTDQVCIELPLQLKYKSKRINNYAAYIITGANCRFNVMLDNINPDDETDGINKNNDNNDKIPIALKIFDIAAEIGTGFDFYTGYFKLGVEIKMSYGLLNVQRKEQYPINNNFDSLRNKTFQLSFTFE